MDAFVQLVSQVGLPLVLLAVIGAVMWRACNYVVQSFVEPMRKRFMGTEGTPGILDKYSDLADTATRSMREVADQMEHMNESLTAISSKNKDALVELVALHSDPSSPISTVKTNQGIVQLAQQIELLSREMQDDTARDEIKKHAEEIKEMLRR